MCGCGCGKCGDEKMEKPSGSLHTHKSVVGKSRYEVMAGRKHFVVPVVAIVEGVLNGGLVTASEFGAFVDSWNGRPVPVRHPVGDDGGYVTAGRPDVFAKDVIGTVFNSAVKDNKLVCEIWIDVDKARATGHGAVLNRLERGDKMEVSTSYFCDTSMAEGKHNGKEYYEIHRNIRPDHLALLPDEIGACSVKDGCGANRFNKSAEVPQVKQKESEMEALIEAIIASPHNSFTEADREALAALDEALLAKLMPAEAEAEAQEDKEEPKAEAEDTAKEEEEPAASEGEEEEEKQKANALDAETLAALKEFVAERKAKKDGLVSKLASNSRCAFTKERLAGMDIADLEALNKSISGDYSGRAAGAFANNENKAGAEKGLAVPSVVLKK